ncbi:hypothetical protein HBA55_00210 [Pseudomaricurvus alkylphenolicus]|nr:hypothetical protein [Pseudomaricurvus alkylphenolicus]
MSFCIAFTLALSFSLNAAANDEVKNSGEVKEKAVQHLIVKDVESMDQARKILIEKTAEIQSKKNLDAQTLHQIHMITYTLEKGVAYYAENLTGEWQALAKEIAVVVEDIHINSENNRPQKTGDHLNKYFALADRFISGL